MDPKIIIISLLIGYCFGMFLTADLVALKYTGHNASKIGTTGNPGMANIMANLGMKAGLIVLAGDLIKCAAAILISWLIFRAPDRSDILFAGLGATLGHDFPAWRRFRGGKGVTCSCLAIVWYSPLWGLIAVLAGLAVVIVSRYLCIGGIVIPVVFTILMGVQKNIPAVIVGVIHILLSVWCNRKSLRGIRDGSTKKDSPFSRSRKGKEKNGQPEQPAESKEENDV